MTRTQILVHRWGPEQGFRCCFADGLNQSLVPFVAQVAHCCLLSSFWLSCTPVPCFCWAGYWSSSPTPPPPTPFRPAFTYDVSLSTETDIVLTELARVTIFLFQLLFTFTLPRSRIPNYHLRRDEKGKINAFDFEGIWEVNKLQLKQECICMFMFAFLFFASLSFLGDLRNGIEKRGGRWEGGKRRQRGQVVSERRTCNPMVPDSSPARATCWISTRLSRVQILGHACKWPTGCLLPVGVINPVMLYLNYLFLSIWVACL